MSEPTLNHIDPNFLENTKRRLTQMYKILSLYDKKIKELEERISLLEIQITREVADDGISDT